MKNLIIPFPGYDGIPAMPDALTEEDLRTWAETEDTYLIPHAIAMIKGLITNDDFVFGTWYKRSGLMEPDKTTITIPAGMQVAVNGNLYISTEDAEIDLDDVDTAANRAGKDVYVYACAPASGTKPVFVASLNSTVPSGYTAETSRKIGGFHCLCADVGTIEGHTLSGYIAGDILPLSVWDLLFRAESENEGMVYVNGEWVDIYPPSYISGNVKSLYGQGVKTSTTGDWFVDIAALTNKELISRNKFVIASTGSNQMTTIDTYVYTVGGHVDTNDRRMISNYGLEDCCGYRWQWTSDIWGAPNVGGSASSTWIHQDILEPYRQTAASEGVAAEQGRHYIQGYARQDDGRGTYNVGIDGANATNAYGLAYGSVMRACVGGSSDGNEANGSRCIHLQQLSSRAFASARLVSKPRIVNL